MIKFHFVMFRVYVPDNYLDFVCVCAFYSFGKKTQACVTNYHYHTKREGKKKALNAPIFTSSCIQIQVYPASSENIDDCTIFTIQFLQFTVVGHVVQIL